ncbi:MAG: response regulator [Spirochaetales bacterium]|nr:response regulator [Spirochaetales bacterium]
MSKQLNHKKNTLEVVVKERTNQLKLSRDRAQNYLDIAGVMLIALNREGEIIMVNQKGAEILGITEDEALGRDWFDHFIPQNMAEEIKHVFNQLLHGETPLVEYYENPIRTTSGEERLIAFHNSLLKNSQGEITGVLWSGEDVTDQRLMQEEALKLSEQLRQSHKMEAIGTLAGGIANDVNNILAAIIGYADLAQDDIPKESPAQLHIQQISKAGHRAIDLVKQIMAFSRQEATERIPLHIPPIIKETLKLLRATLPTTIEIRQNIEPTCGNILADPTAIHQVLLNLCTNSAQAMEETGGILGISLKDITITGKQQQLESKLLPGLYVQLTVQDNGIGIAPDVIERIFDPYFTTKEVGRGSGMGLAVVVGIVKSHDGLITVDSSPATGTIFKVYFPQTFAEITAQDNNTAPLPSGKEKILIVDDEEPIVTMFKRLLSRRGYQTTAITSSTEALELFRAHPDGFDLVLTDQTMPLLTGEQLTKELLKLRPELPIIICSGNSEKMSRKKALSIGIKVYMTKPVDARELALTIRQVLDDAAQ